MLKRALEVGSRARNRI